MPIDLRSTVLKLAANALKQSGAQPETSPAPAKPHLSTGKAVLLGAGLATAGRALLSERGREMVGAMRDRLEEPDAQAEDSEEDEYEDEYDEPEAEADEDYDDEDEYDEEYDEPEAEADDDYEDEPEEEPEPPRRRSRSRA